MKSINLVTLAILIAGGLKRGMVLWFGENVVSPLFGASTLLGRLRE